MEEIFIFDILQLRVTGLNIPGILLIPEFKVLIDKDKTKDKKNSWDSFTYMFLMESFRSPLKGYSSIERQKESLKAADITVVSNELNIATEYYSNLNWNTPVLRMIKKMRKGLERLEGYYDVVNFTEKVDSGARKGTMLYDPKELVSIMKDAKQIIERVKELEELAKQEIESVAEARGGQQGGIFN